MGQQTTVTVKRHKVEMATGVAVQIDSINQDMLAYDQGAAPYDAYSIYSLWNNQDIRRGDTLTDEKSGVVYSVVNSPEQYFNGTTEIKAVVPLGT